MKIVLLGTGGYYPNDQRHTAGIWIPEYRIVLDAGTGIYRLNQLPVEPEYDIFISHAHLDHIAGLTYLLPILLGPQPPSMRVHATAKTLHAIRQHLFAEPIFPVQPPWEVMPLSRTQTLPNGVQVHTFPLEHPGGSTGFRLEFPRGQRVSYVTDTTAAPDAAYAAEIRESDLLIHECNFGNHHEDLAKLTGHSTLDAVLEVFERSECQRLVLVHLDPFQPPTEELERAAATSSGRILLGRDLLEISLDDPS